METLGEHSVDPIDLVCVNLYPFERVSRDARRRRTHEVIENIDIGGPTLIRAAAKNHDVLGRGGHAGELRRGARGARGVGREAVAADAPSLAMEAFAYTARYDAAIARWFAEREDDFPSQYTRSFEKVLDLTYGENPHQRAAYYAETARAHAPDVDGVEAARQGAVLQQPARPRLGAAGDRGVRAAGRGDHQAQQPVRRGGRRDDRGGVRQGARDGSAERVRRRVLLQPAGRACRWRRS